MILSRVEAVSFVSFYIVEPPVFHRPLFEQLSQSLALIADCVLRVIEQSLKTLDCFSFLNSILTYIALLWRIFSYVWSASTPVTLRHRHL